MDQVRSDIALLYRRAGFGATPAELDALTPDGYEAAVEGLVAGLSGPDPGGDAVVAPTLSLEGPPAGPPGSAARTAQQRRLQVGHDALAQWWAQRMISTSTPLREKLVLLWHGHFATGFAKVRDAELMYQQNQTFRVLGTGPFEPLVQAVAKGGAMMRWLDTATDVAAHPNENFAREMLELFVLGIGSYTEDDVVAAARAFTGWTTDRSTGDWALRPRQHDDGPKTFLGDTGDLSGEEVVHIAVTRPASAGFVVAALWSHLAYPVAPDDPVVGDLIPTYGADLDVTAVLRAALLHPAFRSDTARQGLVRQPVEYLVGAARSLGLDASLSRPGLADGRATSISELSTAMAQTLFDPPNVGGWGQNDYWLDTATALARLDAAALMASRADLSAVAALPAAGRADAVATLLGVDGWGPTTSAALAHAAGDPESLLAAALTAPEMVLA